jgi:hypothetical protein
MRNICIYGFKYNLGIESDAVLSMADGDHGGKPKICNGAAILHILVMTVVKNM